MLPKNLIARLFRAGSQQQDEVLEALYRARSASDGDAKESNKQREKREVS
jgi:hypothetical protein